MHKLLPFNMANCKTMKTEAWDNTKNKDFIKTTGFHDRKTTKDHLPRMVTPMFLIVGDVSFE